MGHAIITGADTKFFGMLEKLIASLEAHVARDDVTLCVYDFGLKPEERARLQGRVAHIVTPGWDFDFPCLAGAPDYKKVTTVAPFHPKHFPGFDVYMWIDADVWCQTGEAIDLFIAGALKGRFAVVPEVDRSFPSPIASGRTKVYRSIPFLKGRRRRLITWMHRRFTRIYDREIANLTLFRPALNAGIYALHREAPHWALWAESFRKARFRHWRILTDQGPLNHAYYTTSFDAELLPGWCNWTCHARIPAYDTRTRRFVEPYLPHHPISLMHLVNETKSELYDIETLEGYLIRGRLGYRALDDLALPADDEAPPA